MIETPLFFAIAIPAVVLMGMSKGGFSGLGLISMPMLALVVSPVTAAAIMLPILIVQDAVSVWAYRRDFDPRLLYIMVPGSIAGIAIGWIFAAQVPEAAVRVGVGLISVGFVALYWRRRSVMEEAERERRSVLAGGFWGVVAGYTSFVAHAGGPPFQVYVLPQRLSPLLYAGTSTMFFAITNLVKVVPYVALGQFSTENLRASALLFPLAIASTFLGVWMVKRIDAKRFFTLIYVLSFVVGVKLIWDGFRDLL
ncbi:UPF0721 transmembrane protein [Alsobacter metallidurans]|uniref:Probable membrane transporter protein n=1 Tax=Alsobacter metallidurans TaxID=340221 RepID=A0A917IAR9_9HYPH|nr:sulfite exporter TauE/SafE family protein [Alsobacter metallidurans]GGH30005.1 UPF0721 transmembrane protein [Alsobacter metallidurans]